MCAELASLGLLATRDNPNPRQVWKGVGQYWGVSGGA